MELTTLIEQLSRADAYPMPVEAVEICHTHISVVFLAGDFAFKVKKPVQMGFLDFSTLEKRRHFCEEEVRLNRRLAPEVYLGAVPITQSERGVRMEGSGEAIEWAVKMKRLPEEATLQSRLHHEIVSVETVEAIAERIASFHAEADSGERVASFGRFEVVESNARENFEQAVPQIGVAVSRDVFDRLRSLTEVELVRHRDLIERRAARRRTRDCHGDLRLGHVYLFPERQPPENLAIVDCIEFNERFRFADPVADMGFLAMGLAFHGRRDLAETFCDAYFRASGDHEGRMLLPFYTSYRATVRGKVEGFKLAREEIPATEREAALAKAKAYWLFALGELESPRRRPCLVLVGGLPGTGKSSLAQGLAREASFQVIRSDVVRKELASTNRGDTPASFGQGIYTPEWTDRTYQECLRRAEALVFQGKRVVVDASFREEKNRQEFLEAAIRWGVPALLLLCEAEPSTVRLRLQNRRNDASDADWEIYQQAAARWETSTQHTRPYCKVISTEASAAEVLSKAIEELQHHRL